MSDRYEYEGEFWMDLNMGRVLSDTQMGRSFMLNFAMVPEKEKKTLLALLGQYFV